MMIFDPLPKLTTAPEKESVEIKLEFDPLGMGAMQESGGSEVSGPKILSVVVVVEVLVSVIVEAGMVVLIPIPGTAVVRMPTTNAVTTMPARPETSKDFGTPLPSDLCARTVKSFR